MVKRRQFAPRGFTLVGMIIVFTVMTVMLSAAMPMWQPDNPCDNVIRRFAQ